MSQLVAFLCFVVFLTAVVAGGVGYHYGHKHATTECALAMAEHLKQDAEQTRVALEHTRAVEQDYAVSQHSLGVSLERERQALASVPATVATDLGAGRLRLQQRWDCPKPAPTPVPKDSPAASVAADPTTDRAESAGRIVQAGAEADARDAGWFAYADSIQREQGSPALERIDAPTSK